MKQLVCSVALLLSAAFPASAEVRFEGRTVTTAATNCAYTTAGDSRNSRMEPPGVAGNTGTGGLTMLSPGSGYTVEFGSIMPAVNVFTNVNTVEVGDFGFDVYTTRIKLTKVLPATITTNTKSLYLEGTIEEPFGEKFSPGLCVVKFRSGLVREF